MKERVNAYDCPKCGKTTWTVDVDEGVTPFLFGCRATPGCRGSAASRFYRVPSDHPEPMVEWYRPTKAQAKRVDRKHPGMYEHFKQGGLFHRPARAPEPTPDLTHRPGRAL